MRLSGVGEGQEHDGTHERMREWDDKEPTPSRIHGTVADHDMQGSGPPQIAPSSENIAFQAESNEPFCRSLKLSAGFCEPL